MKLKKQIRLLEEILFFLNAGFSMAEFCEITNDLELSKFIEKGELFSEYLKSKNINAIALKIVIAKEKKQNLLSGLNYALGYLKLLKKTNLKGRLKR